MLHTRIAIFSIAAGLACSQARAADLIATRPGVMCTSPDALAQLTLPNGESRSHGTAATPAQLALARSGGCVDIQPGITVTVQTARKNTSIVTFRQPGGGAAQTFVIPNVDFAPMSAAAAASSGASQTASPMTPTSTPISTSTGTPTPAVPQGYRLVQRVPGAAGDMLEILEDKRITPQVQEQMWGTGANLNDLKGQPADPTPVRNAQLRLVSASGAISATRQFDYPLARLDTAPLHGLPSLALFLSVDATQPTGSYNGPFTELLMPSKGSLDAVRYTTDNGKGGEVVLARTGKADWKIVPSRKAGVEDILQVSSSADGGGKFITTYQTYRFTAGAWQVLSRQRPGYWESDNNFPKRAQFP